MRAGPEAVLAAVVFSVLCVSMAQAELPKAEVPGTSPSGDEHPTTGAPAARRTPTARPDPNYPKPEPVKPKGRPDEAPKLPGSGRQEAVPGS